MTSEPQAEQPQKSHGVFTIFMVVVSILLFVGIVIGFSVWGSKKAPPQRTSSASVMTDEQREQAKIEEHDAARREYRPDQVTFVNGYFFVHGHYFAAERISEIADISQYDDLPRTKIYLTTSRAEDQTVFLNARASDFAASVPHVSRR